MINYIIKYPIIGINVFITLLPIILMSFRRESKIPLRIFFYFLVSKFVFDLIGMYLASNGMNSLLVCNIWVLTSFIFISLIFYHIFINDRVKGFILCCIALYLLFFLFDITHFNLNLADLRNHRYTAFAPVIRSVLILIFCMTFYWELIQELYIDDITKSLIFWMVCGLFIYHSVCLFTESINYIHFTWNSDKSLMVVAYMPYIFESVIMIMFSIGIFYTKNNLKIKE